MKRATYFSALFALFLAACQQVGPGGDEGPIKIGYIGPLTGDAASYGSDTLNGTLMKVDELNAAGGINGRMIKLIVEDAKCTGVDAASAAQKLVNVNKVVAIVGGQCSGETLGAAPISEAAGIVQISAVSSSPDVTDAGDFIFRDYPSDALKTQAMAKYFKEKGYNKVAIITENTDFAVAFRDALVKNVGEDAMVMDELVEPNTKDFRTLITRLKNVEFDVFFPNGQTVGTIGPMMQQFREQGFEQPAVSHDVALDASILEIAPDAVEGMQAIGVPLLGEGTDFGKEFLEKYGEAQAALAFAAHAYDAMGVLAEAMGSVGTDGEKIRDYFYNLDGYDGVVGRFSFDENGDVLGIPYVLYEVKEGEWVKISDILVD